MKVESVEHLKRSHSVSEDVPPYLDVLRKSLMRMNEVQLPGGFFLKYIWIS